jgi:hypothetical protein
MANYSALVALVGEDVLAEQEQDMMKWSCFVKGKDGFLYGIPHGARRVVKFNPIDKSMELIGPVVHYEWFCGVLFAKNGLIYCPPHYFNSQMLKINTIDSTVEVIVVEMPPWFDSDYGAAWMSGAVGPDECIYYMPVQSQSILRLDPSNDTLSCITMPRELPPFERDDFCAIRWEASHNVRGTVLGKDNCIYGLPKGYQGRVVRFDPTGEPDDNISYFKQYNEFDSGFKSDGVLGCDGNIYGLNEYGQVLQVDTSARTVRPIGERHPLNSKIRKGVAGNPIIGLDQCIYWPPATKNQLVKFDPAVKKLPLFVVLETMGDGWHGGALANDGVIYCPPLSSNQDQVLAIDPWKALCLAMNESMILHPEDLGRLFVQKGVFCRESLFDSIVRNFGHDRAYHLLDEYLPSDDEWAEYGASDCLPLFMVAASSGDDEAPLGVIYHLARRNIHGLLTCS